MAGLTTPAIIVIVIVACLAVVSFGAALTRTLYPAESTDRRFQPSYDQEMYMRSVRRKNLGIFHRESLSTTSWLGPGSGSGPGPGSMGRDLESRYTSEETSSRG